MIIKAWIRIKESLIHNSSFDTKVWRCNNISSAILIMTLAQLHKEASDIFRLHQILLQIDNYLIL